MAPDRISQIDLSTLPSPCYLVDEAALEENLAVLNDVRERSGCKILLALKAFAMPAAFPAIRNVLDGVCASSPHEARLGQETFGKEVHSYAPAYSEADIQALIKHSDHLIFNSVTQWQRFRSAIPSKIQCGFRINPEVSVAKVALYDPCGPNSRLGIPLQNFPKNLDGISGLHFHALCEQDAAPLKKIVGIVEEKLGRLLSRMDWVNFGGGHHITKTGYDLDLLVDIIRTFQDKYGVQVYLEPGEAVALNTGILVTTVLDVVNNGMQIAILDTSAEAHMPDVLAAPYRPDLIGAAKPGIQPWTYRLTGVTCLAGDVIGDYSFARELRPGNKLVFLDMAHYTMVKNTTFNGIQLPALVLMAKNGRTHLVRQFGYEDYKSRLS